MFARSFPKQSGLIVAFRAKRANIAWFDIAGEGGGGGGEGGFISGENCVSNSCHVVHIYIHTWLLMRAASRSRYRVRRVNKATGSRNATRTHPVFAVSVNRLRPCYRPFRSASNAVQPPGITPSAKFSTDVETPLATPFCVSSMVIELGSVLGSDGSLFAQLHDARSKILTLTRRGILPPMIKSFGEIISTRARSCTDFFNIFRWHFLSRAFPWFLIVKFWRWLY